MPCLTWFIWHLTVTCPWMKDNGDAMGRLIQLTDEGFVRIQPRTWRVQWCRKGAKQCKTIGAAMNLLRNGRY
jgi:hypothetical protein